MKNSIKFICFIFLFLFMTTLITACEDKKEKDINDSKNWTISIRYALSTSSYINTNIDDVSSYTFTYEDEYIPTITIFIDGAVYSFYIKVESKQRFDPVSDNWDYVDSMIREGIYKVNYTVYKDETASDSLEEFTINIIIKQKELIIEENDYNEKYLFNNGKSRFKLTPEYDGNYAIIVNTQEHFTMQLCYFDNEGKENIQSINNEQDIFLNQNEIYYLDITFDENESSEWKYCLMSIWYEFTPVQLPFETPKTDTYKNLESKIYSFTPEETSNYIISLLNYEGFCLEIYEKGGSGEPIYGNAVEVLLNEGITYYIKSNNLVNGTYENTLLLEKGRSINPNTQNKLNFTGKQTIYLKADIPFNGKYSVSINNSNISIEKYYKNGNLITGEYLEDVCYLKLTNNSNERQNNVELTLEFNPSEAKFGSKTAEEYLKFIPYSSNYYQLIGEDNYIDAIYDYNFNSVEYDTITKKAYLEEDKTYYIHTGGNAGYINIGVNAVELNEITDEKSTVADSKGFAYFTVDITYAGNREFTCSNDFSIYNSKMQLLYSNRAYMDMAVGRYYIRINSVPDSETSLKIFYDAYKLYTDNIYVLENNGLNIFRFEPKNSHDYKFETYGSNDNFLKSKISIYWLNGQELELWGEVGTDLKERYVSIEITLLKGNNFYIIVELANAQGASLLFEATYVE